MANGSFPQRVGSRASVTLFASDLTAHAHLVNVEEYPGARAVGARFSDGMGVEAAIIGDRSSVRMVLAAALHQLGLEVEVESDPAAE